MKILLIGKSGQLGSELIRNNPGHEIIAPGRDELDISNGAATAQFISDLRPTVVINTAAFHCSPL